MMAASHGRVDIAQWLLDHGADVKSASHRGWNAAHHACRSGSTEVLRVMQATDVDWHARVPYELKSRKFQEVTILHIAAWRGHTVLLEYIIDNGLSNDLECVTACGATPLYFAVLGKRTATVAWLLSKNVTRSTMSAGESPLHLCIILGYSQIYALFKSRKCDTTATTLDGLDCEMLAWKYGHKELADGIGKEKGMLNLFLSA